MKELRVLLWLIIVAIAAIGLAAGEIKVSRPTDVLFLFLWFGSIAFLADVLSWGRHGENGMKIETVEETEAILTDRFDWGTITRCTVCGGERRMVTSGYHDALDRDQVEIFVRQHAANCEHFLSPEDCPLPSEMIRQFACIDYAGLEDETGREDEALGYTALYISWIRGSSAPMWNSIIHHSQSSFFEWQRGESTVVLGVIQGTRAEDVIVTMDVKEPGGSVPFERFRMDPNDPSAIGRKIYDVIGPRHN